MDWYARVLTAGGAASATTVAAVSKFAAQCRLAGIWDKLNRVNLFCGGQLTAALVPLKVGSGSATDTNVNFVSGDYTEATGITGNGSSKYLTTGLVDSTFGLDAHVAIYYKSIPSQALAWAIGTSNTSLNRNSTPAVGGRVGNNAVEAGSATAAIACFAVVSRISSTDLRYYRNGSQLGVTVTTASSNTTGANNIHVFRLDGVGRYEAATLAGYSIGTNLSVAEVSTYNTIMEAFQDALGRGVQ